LLCLATFTQPWRTIRNDEQTPGKRMSPLRATVFLRRIWIFRLPTPSPPTSPIKQTQSRAKIIIELLWNYYPSYRVIRERSTLSAWIRCTNVYRQYLLYLYLNYLFKIKLTVAAAIFLVFEIPICTSSATLQIMSEIMVMDYISEFVIDRCEQFLFSIISLVIGIEK
jgi:hypothetical protein